MGHEVDAVDSEVVAAVAFNPPDVAGAEGQHEEPQRNDDGLRFETEEGEKDGSKYIGSNLVKKFGRKAYCGKVVASCPETNLWHVVYYDSVSTEFPVSQAH